MHITPSFSDTNMDVTWQDELGNALHFSGAGPAAQSPGWQLLWEVGLVEQMQVGSASPGIKTAAGVLKFIQLVTWLSLE